MNEEQKNKWLTASEEKKLKSLGEKYGRLENERIKLLARARILIGFKDCLIDDPIEASEELQEIHTNDFENVFLSYAKEAKARWAYEESLKKIKSIMKEIDLTPDDIEWNEEE